MTWESLKTKLNLRFWIIWILLSICVFVALAAYWGWRQTKAQEENLSWTKLIIQNQAILKDINESQKQNERILQEGGNTQQQNKRILGNIEALQRKLIDSYNILLHNQELLKQNKDYWVAEFTMLQTKLEGLRKTLEDHEARMKQNNKETR
jgi:hypothetical protein